MTLTSEQNDRTCLIPAAADLDNWSARQWSHGVQIDQFDVLDSLVIQTQNTTYEITILCGRTGEVLVRGGKYFPVTTSARLSGASLGGSLLKMRGIYTGFRMELIHEGRYILTSAVCSIGLA